MLMHSLRLAGLIFLLWVVPALGQSSATAAPPWIAALRDGGYVIVVRHGATYADQADTNPLDPKDTAHQRQLNDAGRAAAPNENNRRTAALRTLAATPPPAGTNIVLVTHKPNIVDAFGKDWFDVREGEASIFRPDGKGGYTLVARLQAAEWTRLAQAAP